MALGRQFSKVWWFWDSLGPGDPLLQCCTWTNFSSSNETQRNCGVEIIMCISSWSKFWTKKYKKTKNPTATSEEQKQGIGSKVGTAQAPHSTPPEGWGTNASHPFSQTPGHTYPHPIKATSLSSTQEQARETCCYLFSLPPAAAGAPIKPCLNFYLASSQFLLIKDANNLAGNGFVETAATKTRRRRSHKGTWWIHCHKSLKKKIFKTSWDGEEVRRENWPWV